MTRVPPLLRKLPLVFYVAAALILVLGLVLPLHELSRFGYSSKIPVDAAAYKSAVTDLVIRVVSDALYMVANGAVVQVLLAIYDRLAGRPEGPTE